MSRRRGRQQRASSCHRADDRAVPESIYFLGQPRYSQAVSMGLAMLQCFTTSERVLGVADMAELLGLGRSTTHRYAATLQALGWLEQNQVRKYRLTHKAASSGMVVLGEIMLATGCECGRAAG